jgi:hypothetical protein
MLSSVLSSHRPLVVFYLLHFGVLINIFVLMFILVVYGMKVKSSLVLSTAP